MAHELDFSTGKAAIGVMAGTETPWHGYANWMSKEMIDQAMQDNDYSRILDNAGLAFNVLKSPVIFDARLNDGSIIKTPFENRSVVYRDDTGAALSVMSTNSYVPAQPVELVTGLFDVIKGTGYEIDVLGALKGGSIIWALARKTGGEGALGDDIQHQYISLKTSYDGSYARQVSLTPIREVCWNTVSYSAQVARHTTAKQRNSTEFNAINREKLFDNLGEIDAAFASYMEVAKAMTKVKMTSDKLKRFFTKLYAPDAFANEEHWQKSTMDYEAISTNKSNVIADLLDINRDNPGYNLPSADGTLWGAFNTVTFYQDHVARTKNDKRWESAMIGQGSRIKQDALELAQSLV